MRTPSATLKLGVAGGGRGEVDFRELGAWPAMRACCAGNMRGCTMWDVANTRASNLPATVAKAASNHISESPGVCTCYPDCDQIVSRTCWRLGPTIQTCVCSDTALAQVLRRQRPLSMQLWRVCSARTVDVQWTLQWTLNYVSCSQWTLNLNSKKLK